MIPTDHDSLTGDLTGGGWRLIRRVFAFGLVATGTSIAIGALAAAVVVRPDLWMVEHVVFEGAQRATSTSLRHLAELPNGSLWWAVDTDAVADGVRRHPWVRDVDVRREWPASVVVAVREHEPVALLVTDRLLYIADDGTQIIAADAADLDYPVLTGMGPSLAARHPDLPKQAVQAALSLQAGLAAAGVADPSTVSEVAFSSTRGFTVHIGRARLLFAHDYHDAQIARAATLLQQGAIDFSQPIFVDLGGQSTVVVRPLAAPPDLQSGRRAG